MINKVINWTFGSFFRTLGRIMVYILIGFLAFFAFSWFKTVHAASNPVGISLSYLTYNSNDLLINNWYSVGYGNRTFSFDYSMTNIDESLNILYNTIVLCSDSEYGVNGYSGDSSEVFNVRVSTSNYSCSYSNSSYTGGKVVFVTFESYSDGSNSVTVYQNSNASIQLIDFVVTGNGYVNFTDYSSETLINQNSHILNQNDTIISQNSYLIEQNNNTYDMQQKEFNETQEKLDNLNDNITDSNIDTDSSNSFFNNFSSSDNGGISSVITAPLRFIKRLTEKCDPLKITIFDSEIELPCGDTLFWNRSDVSSFRTTWNIIISGPLLYSLLLLLFKVISNIKDPENSKVEVMKL